jgi:hypothetical protein
MGALLRMGRRVSKDEARADNLFSFCFREVGGEGLAKWLKFIYLSA